jgi:hypothetical protein
VSKRTKFILGIGVIAALVIGWQVAAFAVHDTGAFELDGNATNDAAVSGDDWDNVCHQVLGTDCSTTANTNGATATSWVAEPNLNSSIFTGGGSKDPQDVSKWAWKDGAGGLPDKDNLLHSFAARYTTGDGDVLFFGSDRYDNSGDAQQGFWFFQNKITQAGTSSGTFNGVHKNGDLLVVSDFSNGGTTSTITVYEWDTTCTKTTGSTAGTCGDANLRIKASSANANCATAADNDQFCGIVNANTITMPWSFTDKSGTPNNQALNGEFYEGGVNLSALGLDDECFSSVASETRSSTSTTAVLKDFVLGQLQNCSASMTTQASTAGPVTPGTSVTDTATISVSGATQAPDPTGTVTFFLCGPIATGDCSTGGTNIGTGALTGGTNTNDGSATATSPAVNTATDKLAPGRYCFRAEWPGDLNYPGAQSHTDSTTECFTVQDTSAITTTQKWLPQDTASVTLGSGGTPAGTVTFKLYNSADCTGTEVATFTDSSAPFETNNDVYRTADTTVSWKATFTPTNSGVTGSQATCETSTLDITN